MSTKGNTYCMQPVVSSGEIKSGRRRIQLTSSRVCGKRPEDAIHPPGAHLFDEGGSIGAHIPHAFMEEAT